MIRGILRNYVFLPDTIESAYLGHLNSKKFDTIAHTFKLENHSLIIANKMILSKLPVFMWLTSGEM